MKKKHILLLTVSAIITSLLVGCGSSTMKGETTPKDITDSSDPIIGYIIQNVDKAEVPGAVVIFQNGKATWYDDTAYTMGDLSKMTDEEVIENLSGEIKTENNEQVEEYESKIKEYQDELNDLEETSFSYGWSDFKEQIYGDVESGEISLNAEQMLILSDICFGFDVPNSSSSLEEAWENWEVLSNEDRDEIYLSEGCDEKTALSAMRVYDKALTTGQYVEEASAKWEEKKESELTEYQDNIDNLNEQITKLQSAKTTGQEYKTVIDIKTDETGKEVSTEFIMLMDDDGMYMAIPLNSYSVDYSTNGTEIYDSTYYGYTLTDGDSGAGNLFFRETSGKSIELGFDDLDTEGVFVDVEDESELLK